MTTDGRARLAGSPSLDVDAGDRLRAICMALPESEERETFGGPTFRVRAKIFALATQRTGSPAVWIKAPPGSQMVLVNADPARFFVPPYLGTKGWVGIRLEEPIDWREVEILVRRSYRLVAPKAPVRSVVSTGP